MQAWTNKKVKTIIPFINDTISGCNFDDPDISMLLTYIEQIEYYLKQIKRIITEMKELAKELPLYSIVHSLPGIQDILTCKFMAELGDISRFANYKQITAYIGIDPMIRQSGE
jgi:transposase